MKHTYITTLSLLVVATLGACGTDTDATDLTATGTTDSSVVDVTTDIPDGSATTPDLLSSPQDGADSPDSQQDSQQDSQVADQSDNQTHDVVSPDPPRHCDDLQTRLCALPWPSNRFLEVDASRATGYTLRYGPRSLPSNQDGVHVDPDQFTRMDGYSVGVSMIAHFPGIDLSAMATEHDIAPSLAPDHPTVLLEVATDGTVTRVPHWAELDSRAADSPDDQAILLHPAVILKPGTRYVVAFLDIRDATGVPFTPSELMQGYLDGTGDDRQPRFNEIIAFLAQENIVPGAVTLAWDFVTASTEAMHGSMLTMRDKALAAVGDNGPLLTITEVQEYTTEENEHIWLDIKAELQTPNFMKELDGGAATAYVFNLDDQGALTQNGWRVEPVWIRVSHRAKDGSPQSLVNYGHGQNGSGNQVRSEYNAKPMYDHSLIYYGCDLLGMSEPDVPNIVTLIGDMSHFHWMADRLHQGIVNHVLLQLAMQQQFPNLEAITSRNITINADEHFYSGISQGGIYGPSIVALSPFVHRGHLGVPGTNYAQLLSRSKNFAVFYTLIDFSYPSHLTQALILEMIHTLWVQTDSVSWYRRLSADPVPGSSVNQVLLAPAKGDHQVAVVTTETIVRSDLGVALMANYDQERQVPLATETAYPHQGSGMVLYDYGNPWPPPSNLAPTAFENAGEDPHGLPRRADHHNQQMVNFWRTGEIIDVCGGDGCTPE